MEVRHAKQRKKQKLILKHITLLFLLKTQQGFVKDYLMQSVALQGAAQRVQFLFCRKPEIRHQLATPTILALVVRSWETACLFFAGLIYT